MGMGFQETDILKKEVQMGLAAIWDSKYLEYTNFLF
jgi:hypothetical protein